MPLMGLKDLAGKAQELTGSASEAAGKYLDEFNEALPVMRALGFTVRDLHVAMGLLPEIGAKLIGSVDTINVAKINELIEKEKEKKTLVTVLKTLQAAYNVKDQLGDLGLKGVEIDMTLGLPPKIGVAFVK
jgi:hypothetical protein